MNNAVNSNEIPRSKPSFDVGTTVLIGRNTEKARLSGSDSPRILHMSATLRRMLNEADAAQNHLEEGLARA